MADLLSLQFGVAQSFAGLGEHYDTHDLVLGAATYIRD